MSYYDYGWRPYVPVATRRRRAAQKIATLQRSGRAISPVDIDGRTIARTFWGESWCRNLEAYSDYANRLPRGRTYVRNGSVLDLQIEHGRVRALVSGSSLYDVEIEIRPLARKRWKVIKSQCAGKIDSMVELLQGSISRGVMEVVTRKGEGLFPAPQEISLRCSCPDWATMCKHVAAVLYGVGARLDHEPEMLFTLRGVEPTELIAAAVTHVPTTRKSGRRRLLKTDDMSSVFGIELDTGAASTGDKAPQRTRRRKKTATKKATTTRAAAARKKAGARSKATQQTPASRSKAAQKSASARSTNKKKSSSKRTQAVAAKTTAKTSGTGKLSARRKTVWHAAARKPKKTTS
ncbi:MAG: SWIM zinc finger family protein [Acidobacteria bacterium]|nr:SWIM zinc finger family protein [Acidobacteriota bacterium]